jgi:hypothetical protein
MDKFFPDAKKIFTNKVSSTGVPNTQFTNQSPFPEPGFNGNICMQFNSNVNMFLGNKRKPDNKLPGDQSLWVGGNGQSSIPFDKGLTNGVFGVKQKEARELSEKGRTMGFPPMTHMAPIPHTPHMPYVNKHVDNRSPSNSFERSRPKSPSKHNQFYNNNPKYGKPKSAHKSPQASKNVPQRKEYIPPKEAIFNNNKAYQRPPMGEDEDINLFVEEINWSPPEVIVCPTGVKTKPEDEVMRTLAEHLKTAIKKGLYNPTNPELIDYILNHPTRVYTEEDKEKFFASIPSDKWFKKICEDVRKQFSFFELDRNTMDYEDDSDEEGMVRQVVNINKHEPIIISVDDIQPPILKEVVKDEFCLLYEVTKPQEGPKNLLKQEVQKLQIRLNLKPVANLLNTNILRIFDIVPAGELEFGVETKNRLFTTLNLVCGHFNYQHSENTPESHALYSLLRADRFIHITRNSESYFLVHYSNKFLNMNPLSEAGEMVLIRVNDEGLLMKLDGYYKRKAQQDALAQLNKIQGGGIAQINSKSIPITTIKDEQNPFKYSTLLTNVDYEKLSKEKESLETKLKEKEEETKRNKESLKIFYEGMLNSKKKDIIQLEDELEKLKEEKDKMSKDMLTLKTTTRDAIIEREKLKTEISQVKIEKTKLDLNMRDKVDALTEKLTECNEKLKQVGAENSELRAIYSSLEEENKKLKLHTPGRIIIDDYEIIEEKPSPYVDELQKQVNHLEHYRERLLCILCAKNDRNVAFNDCRHVYYCLGCVKDYVCKNPKLKMVKGKSCKANVECPMCKIGGQDILEIFIN